MSTRDIRLTLSLVDNVSERLLSIRKQISDVQGRVIKLQVDGKPLAAATKSAQELAKHAAEAGSRATESLTKAARGATELKTGFVGVQDVFQRGIPDALDKLDARLVSTVSKMTGVSKSMAAVGLAGGAVVVSAVAAGLGASVVSSADLEDAMVRVGKKVGLEGAALEGLQDDVQATMRLTGKSLEEVASAYESAGGMGIGLDLIKEGKYDEARAEISEFVKVNMQAAAAFKMTTESTAELMGGIANVYKPQSVAINTYLKSIASAIDAAADTTVASEEKIITALSHAGSAISQFTPTEKLNKDMVALSAAIISTNVSGDQAGERMMDFLNYATKDKDSAISQALGMGADQYQKALREDPTAMIDRIIGKYNALSYSERGAFSAMFGETGGKLLKSSESESFKKAYADARAETSKAYSEATRLGTAFDKQMGTFWARMDRLKQIVVSLAQIVGGIFLPGLSAIAAGLIAVIDPLVAVVDGMVEFGSAIPGAKLAATALSLVAVAAAIAAIATVIGPIVTGGAAFAAVMATLSAFVASFGAILGWLAAALGAVVAALGWPITIALVLAAALTYVAYKTGALGKALAALKETRLGKDLMALIEWSKLGVVRIEASLMGGLSYIGKKGEAWLQSIGESLSGAILDGVLGLAGLYESALEIFSDIWGVLNWVYDAIMDSVDWLKSGLGITRQEKENEFEATGWGVMTKDGQQKWIAPSGTVTPSAEVPAEIKRSYEDWQSAPKGIFDFGNLYETVKGGIVDGLSTLGDTISEAVSGAIDGVFGEGTTSEVLDAVADTLETVSGILDGVVGTLSGLVDSLRSLPVIGKYFGGSDSEGFAGGATFTAGGKFAGVVHDTEEIIPQAVTKRGPGPLSQLLEELYSTPSSAAESGNIAISSPVTVNIESVSSEVDLDKITQAVENGQRAAWTCLQRRNGSYLRGGSICR